MRYRSSRFTSHRSTSLISTSLVTLGVALGGCTTTYGPDNPPPEEPVTDEAPCEIDDTRPGCSAEDQPCLDPHDYLCGE